MYYHLDSSYSSRNSLPSTPQKQEKAPVSPLFPAKCEIVNGLSSHFGHKLSSFYVIDQELNELPFFNFEEKALKTKKNVEDRSGVFWKKISQIILNPYLTNNRIILHKYMDALKISKERFSIQNQKLQTRKSTMQETHNNLSPESLKIQNKQIKIEKMKIFKKEKRNSHSFDEKRKNNEFGEFCEDFRRNSIYNALEGEMTSKQKKFYRIMLQKKKNESSTNSDIHEEFIERKTEPLKKKQKLNEKKNKLQMITYFRIRPKDKKINFLLSKNNEDSMKDLNQDNQGNYENSLANSEKKIETNSNFSLEAPETNNIFLKQIEPEKESPRNINNESPSLKKMRLNSKKSTFVKNSELHLLSPRRTMPSLTPTFLDFQKLDSKALNKKDSLVEQKSEEKNIVKDFESLIKNINGTQNIKNKTNKKKNQKSSHNNNNSSLWSNKSHLENLIDLKKKMLSKTNENKKHDKNFVQKTKKNVNSFGNLPEIIKSYKEKINSLEKTIESESRKLYYYSKIPKRSEIFSHNKSTNIIYGFSQISSTTKDPHKQKTFFK